MSISVVRSSQSRETVSNLSFRTNPIEGDIGIVVMNSCLKVSKGHIHPFINTWKIISLMFSYSKRQV